MLLSSILQNIPVYWISLSKVPKCILDLIRKFCFSFFWSGPRASSDIPLVKWVNLITPKKMGGCGFKNMHMFDQALATKKLWRSLFYPRLRGEIVRSKYLKIVSISNWFQSVVVNTKGSSNTWKGLINLFELL